MRRVSANKNVLSSRLNWGEVMVRQMSCCRSSAGRLFHSRGPATPKLLSRSLDCVRGTVPTCMWTSAHPWRVGSRRIGIRRGEAKWIYSMISQVKTTARFFLNSNLLSLDAKKSLYRSSIQCSNILEITGLIDIPRKTSRVTDFRFFTYFPEVFHV